MNKIQRTGLAIPQIDVNRVKAVAGDHNQAEQIVREHANLTRLCGELKSKAVKQRQEIARLTREAEQLRSDKANLLFDLVKERTLTALLREQLKDSKIRARCA